MQPDPVTLRELPTIEKIVRDETWLEAERRGKFVSPDDPVVRENVCLVVLRVGEQLRKKFSSFAPARSPATTDARRARQAVLD
jgi:hypothetical protein